MALEFIRQVSCLALKHADLNSLRDMFVREKEFLFDCHRTSSWPQLDTRGRDSQFSNSVKASFCLLRETFESRLLIVSGVVDGVAVAPTSAVLGWCWLVFYTR